MKIKVVAGSTLSPSHVDAWRRIRSANAHLASPFFAPEFTYLVAKSSPDVEVAVLEKCGEIVGFFPYQRGTFGRHGLLGSTLDALGMACPVGRTLSDYQGLIAGPELKIDASSLLRACRLSAWDFDHLCLENTALSADHKSLAQMSILDLSQGFDKVVADKTAAGSQQFVKWARQARVLERDYGTLRFIPKSDDKDALRQVLAMKSEQYIASGQDDLFDHEWIRTLLSDIHDTQCADFAGQLSLLYAGDTLVAGHFGMRSRNILHYWFPVYARAVAKYSPGIVLLVKLADYAHKAGFQRIDIGTGKDKYKEQFRTHTLPLAVGSVEVPSIISLYRAAKEVVSAKAYVAARVLPASSTGYAGVGVAQSAAAQ
jgi:CelD/BcsL family acetyltransferase involved in cellulose biosynthesis